MTDYTLEDYENWPTCSVLTCSSPYHPRRHALGYRTCHRHWMRDPLNATPALILQDVSKSNPTVTRCTDHLNSAYADRQVRSELRSVRSYVPLDASPANRSRDE